MSEEIERLKSENEALNRKCSELEAERAFVKTEQEEPQPQPQPLPDLEELRSRILSNLKLGTQAPGYKVARKALDQMIRELTNE